MREEDPQIVIILGTRPEIIKLSPVIRACQEHNIPFSVLHTGQHYSDGLDSVFFDQLELPAPDLNLQVGSASHGQQTGKMLAGIEEYLLDRQPDTVVVQGDTNSVLAGAIATSKLDADLGHVEAGLRSFDREMPEETNRVVSDHVADILFAPTEQSREYLLQEGIPDSRIEVTGNTVVDALYQNSDLADAKSSALSDLGVSGSDFFLMTAHRAENVDSKSVFEDLLQGVQEAAESFNVEVLYPIHPRAESKVEEFGLRIPERIRVIEPQDYLDFLQLETEASLILTDSGGVQEEACVLQVPCVTLRENTERPETLDVGANVLAGTDPAKIQSCAQEMYERAPTWENPFGDGAASERIISTVTGENQ